MYITIKSIMIMETKYQFWTSAPSMLTDLSVKTRYKLLLRSGDKARRSGRFSPKEDERILRRVVEESKLFHLDVVILPRFSAAGSLCHK